MSEYITLEQADEYFQEERPDAKEWETAIEPSPQKHLNCAENILLAVFQFPAGFLDEVERTRRPWRVFRNAICEQAIYIMQTGVLRKNPKLLMGIQSASVGPLSVTFSKEFDVPLLPEHVRLMLEGIGAVANGTNILRSGTLSF